MAVEAFVDVYLPLLQLEAKSRHPIFASFSVWPAKPRKLLLFVISIRDFKLHVYGKRQASDLR